MSQQLFIVIIFIIIIVIISRKLKYFLNSVVFYHIFFLLLLNKNKKPLEISLKVIFAMVTGVASYKMPDCSVLYTVNLNKLAKCKKFR